MGSKGTMYVLFYGTIGYKQSFNHLNQFFFHYGGAIHSQNRHYDSI